MRESNEFRDTIGSPIERKDGEKSYVFHSFAELGFKIQNLPELYERLIELAWIEQFEDAAKMAQVVDIIWDRLQEFSEIKFDKNELKLACLLHDVGKSGPDNATREQRRLYQILFNPENFNPENIKFKDSILKPKDLTIAEALELEDQITSTDKEKIKQMLAALTVHIYRPEVKEAVGEPLDINRHKMIDFWREHDYWTLDLLVKFGNGKLSENLIIVASSHHTLDGHDPVKEMTREKGKIKAKKNNLLEGEKTAVELLDKYLMLTIIDKYQAWIDRSGISHSDAIIELESQINNSQNSGIITEDVAVRYRHYLGVIAEHKQLPEIINSKK